MEVEKHHFILIIGPHINKYIFQAHYSPKGLWNLGVNFEIGSFSSSMPAATAILIMGYSPDTCKRDSSSPMLLTISFAEFDYENLKN
jgi:hypothetical protein